MSTVQHITTADELLRMPDDGFRYELVRGELRQMSPAGFDHFAIAGRIEASLGHYVYARKLGIVGSEGGFILNQNPDTVRCPDVGFVAQHRLLGSVPTYWIGPPDLVVEVISPNDRYSEVDEKVVDWLEAGALMVVVVNPRRKSVAVYRPGGNVEFLREGRSLDGGDVVKGWSMPVSEIFA